MEGIVLELERDLLSDNCNILNALRKAKVIALKLDLTEFGAWIDKELNGYSIEQEIPSYRIVKGILRARNPYAGWIPAIIDDERMEQDLCERKITSPIICHQPLYLLFRDLNKLNAEEIRFVRTGLSHLDFLIYNNVTKRPFLAIEVDGYRYHKSDSVQGERDRLKNHILEVYHLPLIRFKTNGSGEQEILQDALNRICGGKSG